ncbi:MAG: nitroreductase family deazaflavin-dependent oxidoreductase [Jatrophihabitans sp.]|uniref:nitroreductase family deazaflavin-dependent oxidoreductase n=1 Tax=Jatrophihabitans sp. TaxID=1932789 RepID=UPI003F7FA47E
MGLAHTRLYRLTGGRLGRTWRVGSGLRQPAPVCLLTTTGRKTGRPRTVPLVYFEDDGDIVFIASQGGRAENPMWYGNLVANPEVEIEIGRDKRAYRARTATGAERARLWRRAVAVYADYDNYQSLTEREIPVVVCEPIT